jgi:hypothetical protein
VILIPSRLVRKLGVALAWAAGVLGGIVGPARAEPDAGAMGVAMTCERVDAPGRVRCEVEAHAAPGETIAWGDVAIVKTPAMAAPLRGRIGPHEATARDPAGWRWAFALVARERGSGDVEGRVRLVVCRGQTCAPRELPVVGRVVVGP